MVFLTKESRKIIEKGMNKSLRKKYKKGEEIKVKINRNKYLYRWGDEATLVITKNGKILENNLIAYTWEVEHNNKIENAEKSAAGAIDYFVYGESDEYEIVYS